MRRRRLQRVILIACNWPCESLGRAGKRRAPIGANGLHGMPLQMSRARSASYYKEASRESPSCKVNKTALGQKRRRLGAATTPNGGRMSHMVAAGRSVCLQLAAAAAPTTSGPRAGRPANDGARSLAGRPRARVGAPIGGGRGGALLVARLGRRHLRRSAGGGSLLGWRPATGAGWPTGGWRRRVCALGGGGGGGGGHLPVATRELLASRTAPHWRLALAAPMTFIALQV